MGLRLTENELVTLAEFESVELSEEEEEVDGLLETLRETVGEELWVTDAEDE